VRSLCGRRQGWYLTGYPLLFSGVIVSAIAMLQAYVVLQRYFIESMTAGSVKG
jgi:raffinose/stachyose/melibiose transport system permease protein